jgi:DNA-directed RNA polymerase subunit RPC12/RpoP
VEQVNSKTVKKICQKCGAEFTSDPRSAARRKFCPTCQSRRVIQQQLVDYHQKKLQKELA